MSAAIPFAASALAVTPSTPVPCEPVLRPQIPHPAPAVVAASPVPKPAPSPAPKPVSTKTTAKSEGQTQAKVAVAPAPASVKPSTYAGSLSPVEFTVVLDTLFKNAGTSAVSSGEVTVPLMSLPLSRSQVVLSETITPSPVRTAVDEFGNRTGTFDLTGIAPGETLVVSQRYHLRIWGSGGLGTNGPALPGHLASDAKVEAAAPEIVSLAKSLTAGKDSVLAKIDCIFDYTHSAIKYDANSGSRNQGALAALQSGTGVCEEYASLFVALCRAAGIPARVINGFGRDLASAGAAWRDGGDIRPYRHAWAEAWVPEYGWATFDPTFDRAAISGVASRAIGSGTLIIDNYGDKSILGKYAGGKIEVTRQQRLHW